jgi:hypothetical protein
MKLSDEDLDRAIALHAVRADVDATAARRIRARAHDALGRPPPAWRAWLEPALALALGTAQLVWAFRAVLDVYR